MKNNIVVYFTIFVPQVRGCVQDQRSKGTFQFSYETPRISFCEVKGNLCVRKHIVNARLKR